jgi:hypothetical protein
MSVPASEVGYTTATPRRENHEVHKDMWWHWIKKEVTEWKPHSSRPAGRPRLRWLDQIEEDLKKMKVRNWIEKCKDRRLWNEIVKQAKSPPPRVIAPIEEEEKEEEPTSFVTFCQLAYCISKLFSSQPYAHY